MKRLVISSVVAVCVLLTVIILISRSGSTQSQISDCKEPFGNPSCKVNNNATFNDGKNTGCRLNFTGYDAMASATVRCSTHVLTSDAKAFALVEWRCDLLATDALAGCKPQR